jgi:uncharacterized protein (DUF488 family)
MAFIFTLGHARHDPEKFLRLARKYSLEALVDVRSIPRSRFVAHFSRRALEDLCENNELQYFFLGEGLGGHPRNLLLYDEEGYADYARISKRVEFKDSMRVLLGLVGTLRVALLCSEEDPTTCHRRRLVGKVLREHGHHLGHIRGTGNLESEAAVSLRDPTLPGDPWRSSSPVVGPRAAPRGPPPGSEDWDARS